MRRIGISNWLAIIGLALAGVVWAVRLEGRVNAQELTAAAIELHRKETIDRVHEDLQYIRQRLDQALAEGRAR